METSSNTLRFEKSPYLQQHKSNPVWWQPWGEKAFQRAAHENKLIFLSIGYATCHWCHVMEHESFESQEVADLLNQSFVSVKVDREELPDVDQIYMNAIHALGQRGGWPLSMFLTPDLKPIFGGTYFPKAQFMSLLKQLSALWAENPSQVNETGDQLTQFLKQQAVGNGAAAVELPLAESYKKAFEESVAHSKKTFDATHGGFGGAPKFPPYLQLDLMMRLWHRTQDPSLVEMVDATLDKMARGGIYDHVGGGFSRYSVDTEWLVPHFEKMLYSQALLTRNYIDGFRITRKSEYSVIARETLDYVLRDMTSPQGGFFSAEDADSEKVEGKFYVFKFDELKGAVRTTDFEFLQEHMCLTPSGNFEHGSTILNLAATSDWSVRRTMSYRSLQKKLLEYRSERVRPLRDEKVLTSWNALMISAFASGAQAFGEKKYLDAAEAAARFLKRHLWHSEKLRADDEHPNKLHRRWCQGETKFDGTLDDYAFLIEALLTLYQTNFNFEWYNWAVELQNQQDQIFEDQASGGYFYTSESTPHLLVRVKDASDDALPNANAVSACNLLQFYAFTANLKFKEKAERILAASASEAERFPAAFHQLLMAADFIYSGFKEVVIADVPNGLKLSPKGEKSQSQQWLEQLHTTYWPSKVIAFNLGESDGPEIVSGKIAIDGKPTVYLCEEFRCSAPTHELLLPE